ncbi:hypothetical protein [Sphingopyxis sp. JAI128]|uniref:hypothetical protein n=1 Tax=Sphingopyxis sp. JAI128 TaxID=2723066 RepID=UPI001621EAED|nr:hypothetical protein [Sphingopyxis sp. JAI128]MBB6427477.1 hypothetical protein [Sphingopyxis sp. JAI128]
MKNAIFLAALPLALAAVPAAAQDSESYAINLSGSVASNCELVPEGSGSYNVDMLDTGNQGSLTILYSCNSPYTVSLTSLNGGMEHQESSGAVNIDYDVESIGFGNAGGVSSVNSAAITSPTVIGTNNDWENILTNGGVRTGNLDLSFDSLSEYAVAGTYEDTLTITLAANY